jgi:hypothetical protein
MVDAQLLSVKAFATVNAPVVVALKDPVPPQMDNPTRRSLFDAARRLIEAAPAAQARPAISQGRLVADDSAPRLTSHVLETTRMPRTRDRIMTNLDEMYREAFTRAQATGDDAAMATLDFAYRREQLYFEVLLDIREAVEKAR